MKNQEEIDREAGEWLAIVNSDGAGDEELSAFERWRASDARCDAAFSRLEMMFNEIGDLADLEYLIDAPVRAQRADASPGILEQLKGWLARPLIPISAVAAGIAVMVMVANLSDAPMEPQRYATSTAETRDITLADGSVVTLGARSAAEVTYEDDRRRVALLNGQAFFDVARDPERPFVIAAGGADIKVIGTSFDVTLIRNETRVGVVEGVVSVSAHDAAAARLTAGQALTVTDNGVIGEVRLADLETLTAWRDGRLVYKNAPLGDVIAGINRYAARPVALSPDVDDALTITGAFRADEAEAVIRTVAAAHDLSVDPNIDGTRILQHNQEN
ncbi:MAG: FecR domain-containing protein [Pseudomonadota bacterium]